jgi:hypothetical protein
MSAEARRTARHAPQGPLRETKLNTPLITLAKDSSLHACLTLQLNGNSLTDIWNYCRSREHAPKNPLEPLDTAKASKEELAERLYWIRLEQTLRFQFRRLVQRWITKRYSRRFLNTDDPATLANPIKPVYLYDPRARGTYVFEASTLVKCIDADLGYSEWLFPTPHHPKNPLTNLDFTLAQRIRLLEALQMWHMVPWKLQSYVSCKYKLLAFRDIFMTPLKLHALHDAVEHPELEVTIDFLTEFMEDQYHYHSLHAPATLTVLRWAIRHRPNHWLCADLRQLFERYTRFTYIYGEDYVYTNPIVGDPIFLGTRSALTNQRGLAELRTQRDDWIREQPALNPPLPPAPPLPEPIPNVQAQAQAQPAVQAPPHPLHGLSPPHSPTQFLVAGSANLIIATLNLFPEEEEDHDADTED